MQYTSFSPKLIDMALKAGDILMRHYRTELSVGLKNDNSPVTIADMQADAFITAALRSLTPNIPVISEEGEFDNIPHTNTYWLVDPLDGTRSFVKAEPYFTVNIGLVVNNRAYMGVIYAPALGLLYYTGVDGKAYKVRNGGSPELIKVFRKPTEGQGLRVIASRHHRNALTEEYVQKLNVKDFIETASSYKFCLVAEGSADIYPRFSNTMQWDTAAGHAILEAAGGTMCLADGGEFMYKFNYLDVESLRNPHFVASS